MTDITTSKPTEALSSESVAAQKDLIDELPESLLVDILCRLPRNTIIHQCKCVSKSWSTLISKPCFHAHYLGLQKQKPPIESKIKPPIESSLIMFVLTGEHKIELFTFPREQTLVSEPHKTFPFWEWVKETYKPHQTYKTWVGTCNDLVLQCATPTFQRYCYYISNPHVDHCVTLPPAPQCHHAHVHVGITCDSDHRCKVVRVLECEKQSALFKVEIFSTETCEWTEAVVPLPEGLTCHDIRSSVDNVGIAWKGTLYWLCSSGLVIALDPSKLEHCSFISKPDVAASSSCEQCLTVCLGRLRLCQFHNEPPCPIFYVWDLKEDEHEVDKVGGKKVTWCLKEKIVLDEFTASFYCKPLALDPNDEDILYYTVMIYRPCKSRNLMKQNIRKFDPMYAGQYRIFLPVQDRIEAFPIVFPMLRLPTPVPRLDYQKKICDS